MRRNDGGELVSLIYGRAAAVAVDPIEKKPLYHFHPGTSTLSLGTFGCNMHCKHCQNCEISYAHFKDDLLRTLRDVDPESIVQLTENSGCGGVSFTYNEPTIWIEFILDVFERVKAAGFYTCIVTNGYINPPPLSDLLKLTDAYRADLKFMRKQGALKLAGVSNPEAVLAGIAQASASAAHVEIVTNIVPGINDSRPELCEMAKWLFENCGAETPWHLTRYFPSADWDAPATPVSKLREAIEIAHSVGMKHVYAGNTSEIQANTECPVCGEIVIDRSSYSVRILSPLPVCRKCGYRLNIVP